VSGTTPLGIQGPCLLSIFYVALGGQTPLAYTELPRTPFVTHGRIMNSSSAQSVNNQPITQLLGPPISLRHRDNLSISAATIQTRQRVNGGPSSRLNQPKARRWSKYDHRNTRSSHLGTGELSPSPCARPSTHQPQRRPPFLGLAHHLVPFCSIARPIASRAGHTQRVDGRPLDRLAPLSHSPLTHHTSFLFV
jgi:hypothetical protein